MFSFSCVLWPLGVVVRITWFTVVRWSKILLIGFLAETSLFRRNHGRRYTMKMKRTLRRQTNACQGNARNYNYSPPKRNAGIAWWPDLTSKYTFLVRILRLSTNLTLVKTVIECFQNGFWTKTGHKLPQLPAIDSN